MEGKQLDWGTSPMLGKWTLGAWGQVLVVIDGPSSAITYLL